ncbi:MAG: sigma-70 family RNA polymerase sigma factor [Eubacterium sp.]|nr:sigma-70 family RNA polymerase sigma factor [Eubacterium sp.]
MSADNKDVSARISDISDDEVIAAAKEGNEAAASELLNRYKPLVRKQARALFLIGGENDDLIQEGMIALYKAIKSYDPIERPGMFAAYATTCISNHLYNVIKGANRMKNAPLNQSISLDAPIGASSDDSITVADTLPPDPLSDPARILIEKENEINLREKIRSVLSPFEQEVVGLYIEGDSISGIANKLDKNPKSIDNALQRVKKKLSADG